MKNITSTQLKKMCLSELTSLCDEIRETIISTVMENGGHLSSNLGMVELTVALHYVFDFPRDKVIFDVGHQCYAHKILSGRADDFSTLRTRGGISGFPKRTESDYDCYDTGHAGTSVSAALGMAKARDISGGDYDVIAVIGDGSFNNGLIYEAFNSLRLLDTNILVILNDNGMSISPTVGSMHEYLEMLAGDEEQIQKRENHARIFERFGFEYDGVYDGNDLGEMIARLMAVKEKLRTGSVILHVKTLKGKGYEFCEENPVSTHGIVNEERNKINERYSDALGATLADMARNDGRIVAVTAAMTASLGLGGFFKEFPDRSVDVGICEEHATILCAAMATQGLKPYYAVYSTFMQRSEDEIILDICEQDLPVTICIDKAGITGEDGETHQGIFDLSLLNCVPNLTVAVPKDIEEFKSMIRSSADFYKPLAIRYPTESERIFDSGDCFEFGKWEELRRGDGRFAVLACGERALAVSFAAAEKVKDRGISLRIVNARFVKPLDTDFLSSLNEKHIITVEDNVLAGGFGSAVDAYYSESQKIVRNLAYRDVFIPHGDAHELMPEFGVSEKEIVDFILEHENR